jgi:chromosome segregation ATPase
MQGQSFQDRCVQLQVELTETQARCMVAEAHSGKLQETVRRLREEAERREERIRRLEEEKERMEREIRRKEEELERLKSGKSLYTAPITTFETLNPLLEINAQPRPNVPYRHTELIYASARKPKLDTRQRSLSVHSIPPRCSSRMSTKPPVQYTPSHGRIARKTSKPNPTGHINLPRKSEIRGCWTARGP